MTAHAEADQSHRAAGRGRGCRPGGCGGKADPRTFLSGKKSVPKTVYKIEVAAADEPAAKKELAGKVRPVLSYGYSI